MDSGSLSSDDLDNKVVLASSETTGAVDKGEGVIGEKEKRKSTRLETRAKELNFIASRTVTNCDA